MGNNGLDITEGQFMKMCMKERDLVMFKNITEIRRKFKDYSLHRKIQYLWLIVLTIFVGLKKYIGL